jgi:IclR family transcriptional regulator, acetate operon repressor
MIAPTGTQSIDRAAALLVRVIDTDQPLAVSALADAVGLPKSTASRLVAALERHGLVQRESARAPLTPGPVLLQFARRGSDHHLLLAAASSTMRTVGEESGETVNLAVPTADGAHTIAQVDSHHFLGAGNWVDRPVPTHASAFGKLFVAYGVTRLADGPLHRLAPQTITDPRRLARELARVRRDGYATAVDELEPGLASVAAPICDDRGVVIGALAVSGPTLRMPPKRLVTLARLLHDHAVVIAGRIDSPTATEGGP